MPETDETRFAHAIFEALEFAADKHRDQRRKGSEASPYINHPIQVANVLTSVGGIDDVVTLQAAVLHDTVEDTEATFEEIERRFGRKVCGLVKELTDDKSLDKAERKRLQIEHAPHLSRGAAAIKIADKICNVTDIRRTPPTNWSPARRAQYFDWAERVVNACPEGNEGLKKHFAACVAQSRNAAGIVSVG